VRVVRLPARLSRRQAEGGRILGDSSVVTQSQRLSQRWLFLFALARGGKRFGENSEKLLLLSVCFSSGRHCGCSRLVVISGHTAQIHSLRTFFGKRYFLISTTSFSVFLRTISLTLLQSVPCPRRYGSAYFAAATAKSLARSRKLSSLETSISVSCGFSPWNWIKFPIPSWILG